ncbi:hypothetical protein Fmac_001548 [Flemingia macrophylla]|uniref:Uncharacterized protein n=1 Tax=Flemingia macrophylla TaxID=520843 RepID=A0ABD1NHE9_9FABA
MMPPMSRLNFVGEFVFIEPLQTQLADEFVFIKLLQTQLADEFADPAIFAREIMLMSFEEFLFLKRGRRRTSLPFPLKSRHHFSFPKLLLYSYVELPTPKPSWFCSQELNESRSELLGRVQSLKQDLQSWRSKLDTQVKVYRDYVNGYRTSYLKQVVFQNASYYMSSIGNNEVGEKSSPHPKKAQKLAAKGKRSRYVIKVSPLSSPSEPNASPHSIPSTRQENVVMQEQTSSEATQPCVPVDPPPGAILPVIEPYKDGTLKRYFLKPNLKLHHVVVGRESSPLDPGVEEKIGNQSWFFYCFGGINKGRVYGVGKVEAGYRCGNNFTQPTTSSASSQKITMLEEKVRKTQEENERLSRKFETLLNVVLPLLPVDLCTTNFSTIEQNQQDPQATIPQPSNQAAENQENNDHFPSNYEDY